MFEGSDQKRRSCDAVLVFRDVSSVELLMNNHQGIKAEIDARNDSFTACIELGKALLARKHYASEEVETFLTRSERAKAAATSFITLFVVMSSLY